MVAEKSGKKVIFAKGHRGGLLERALEVYPTAVPVYKELLQNAVDLESGGATSILLIVDLDSGEVSFFDNGAGMSSKIVHEALESIGRSVKGGRGDRYGRFGLGMVSPLSIHASFEIITASTGHVYQSYEFDRKKMFETKEEGWPFYNQPEPSFAHEDGRTPKQKGTSYRESVWWRTQVKMYGLTTDKVKRRFDFDQFKSEVQIEYGAKLASLGTSIKVVVIEEGKRTEQTFKAKKFEGKELPVWVFDDEAAGKVEVMFYLAPVGHKGPLRIGVGSQSNPFRLPLRADRLNEGSFYRMLDEKTKTAIASGMFQGEILAENLVLRSSRKGFEEGDAQLALACAVDTWYKTIGSTYYNDEKAKREAVRHQVLVEEALLKIGDFLKKDTSPFASLFVNAKFGSVGIGHVDLPGTDVTGFGMTGKNVTPIRRGKSAAKKSEPGTKDEKKAHHPVVVVGKGSERKVVRGHSSGLHVVSDDLGSKLWFFNPESVCLKINPTHPLVEMVDTSDAKVRDLYQKIIISALRVALMSPNQQETAQAFAELAVDDFVKMMLMKR